MRAILVTMAALILGVTSVAAIGAPAEARTHKPRAPKAHVPRPHKIRVPKSTYKTVRVRRADGTVMTGYKDSAGTHLRRPDGSFTHCQRQVSAAEIDVSCH
jgi:DNA/RNA endonuclease G (NUC1)